MWTAELIKIPIQFKVVCVNGALDASCNTLLPSIKLGLDASCSSAAGACDLTHAELLQSNCVYI